MADQIIKELWKTKDDMAREFGNDAAALVAHLRTEKRSVGERIVDLRTKSRTGEPPPGAG